MLQGAVGAARRCKLVPHACRALRATVGELAAVERLEDGGGGRRVEDVDHREGPGRRGLEQLAADQRARHLGFGRIVVSETERPNLFVNLV